MSEWQLRAVDDVEYIVGRPFTSEEGEHTTGDVIPSELANSWRYLEAFIDSGYLYRVRDRAYDRLPPHVFNHVNSRQEAEEKIAGDDSNISMQNDWNKSPEMLQAEREAEVQTELHQNVLQYAQDAHEAKGYTKAETRLLKEQESLETDSGSKVTTKQEAPARRATKKTAAKKA